MAPASQELQLRRAGVPRDHIYRDVGASGSTGTQERRGWHRLNGRLAATPWWWWPARRPLARHHQEHLRAAGPGGKDPLPAETGVGIIGMDSPIYKIMEAPDCEPRPAGIDQEG